jgi:hypothetical protein
VVDEQEHESNEREPPPRKPLVNRILCAFKCQYHRFTRPSKNGETENQKNERGRQQDLAMSGRADRPTRPSSSRRRQNRTALKSLLEPVDPALPLADNPARVLDVLVRRAALR